MIDEKKLLAKLVEWEKESKEEAGLKAPALLRRVMEEVRHEATNEEIRARIEAAKSDDREWIPVTERLPEQIGGESEEVLCLYATGDQRVGLTCEGNAWISAETGMEFLYEVIAWRPLPEPYREEREGGQ